VELIRRLLPSLEGRPKSLLHGHHPSRPVYRTEFGRYTLPAVHFSAELLEGRSKSLLHGHRVRAQAVVEFGLVALLFITLVFATIDFGLLLNTWISTSSASRELARSASVGKQELFLRDEASRLNLPSVDTRAFPNRCCDDASAVEIKIEYFDHTKPGCMSPSTPASCPVPVGDVYNLYPSPNADRTGSCSVSPSLPGSNCHPQTDDWVTVTVIAHGAQVITPLVRPIFGCTNGSNPNCFVPLSSSTTMRYEGGEF